MAERPPTACSQRNLAARLIGALAFGAVLLSPALAAARAPFPGASDTRSGAAADELTAWIAETADNQGLPFLVVDKVNARVLAFDAQGNLLGAAPALVGLTPGDISPPGIGDRPLSAIGPKDRITPAGRFVASLGENLGGKDILWIDYDSALSLHPVVTTRAADRRLQRLATETADDNRISYGCVNVPASFYAHVVQPAFSGTVGVVYILPDTRALADVFALAPSGPVALD